MAGTVLIALLFGTISAWFVSVFDFPGRSVFKWALVLPLALPTYIASYIYGSLLGATGTWSLKLHEFWGLNFDIMTESGLMLVLASVLFPYVYLPARALFTFGSGHLQEAARTLGARNSTLFFKIGLPLARPALAGGALLVCMEVLNDYGAVKYFGVQTLTTGIFKSWHNMGDLGTALRIGTILLVLVAILRSIERAQRKGKKFSFEPHTIKRTRLKGSVGLFATLYCMIPFLLGALIPLFKITQDLFVGSHWEAAMEYDLLPIVGNTVMLALCVSLFAVALSILFVYAKRYADSGIMKVLVGLSSLGYVIPGAVIAVGVMTIAGYWDRNTSFVVLIGSLALIIFAMVVRFLAVSLETLHSGSTAIEKNMDESARVLGADPLRAFFQVNLPLIKKSLSAAAILVFIEVVKELPLTLILKPFNFETLATQAYRFANIELLEEASVAAAFIVLCSLVPIILLERQFSSSK